MNVRKLFISLLIFVCVLLSACAPAVTATQAPTSVPPTAIVSTATPTQQTTYHSPANAMFRLPLAFTYGPDWDTGVHANAIDIVYKNQWGGGIVLLNGALVHDPATAVSDQSASANKADYVPLPDDFFAYLTSLPGVKVITAASPVTIGGVQGTQIIIKTPPMHPILWLKDDYSWLGGGASGVDPEFKRLMILLEVNGERVLLEFDDTPEKFDERYPLIQEIFNSITFGK